MKKNKKNETVLEKEYTSLYEDNKKRSDNIMIEKIETELEKLNNDRELTIQKINFPIYNFHPGDIPSYRGVLIPYFILKHKLSF